jgi:DnaJ-class molecular chaperone
VNEQPAIDSFALETPCEHCRGKGGFWMNPCWFDCEECSGIGYRLTEFGKRVAAMVERHVRVNPAESDRSGNGLKKGLPPIGRVD